MSMHVRRSVAQANWNRNSCYIGIRIACPSPQQLQQRVGRGNGVGSHQAADRQLSPSEAQRDSKLKRADANIP